MLQKIFVNNNQRSTKAYKNIIALFAIKGLGMAINLLLIPLTLHYLDTTRYGIWITINTFFAWLSLFDIGLGNGLRNRLTEALAVNDTSKARIYVSTTYVGLLIIFILVYIIFFITNHFLDWTIILNTGKEMKDELGQLVNIIFLLFCLQFILNLITTIALAKQEPALTQAFGVLGNLISLLCIYLLTLFTHGKLIYLGIILAGSPLITTSIISFILFNKRYKDIKPSLKYVRFSELKGLLNIGIKFFFIQIAAIVFYQTNNIIITQLFGPQEVTTYNIAFQYFGIATFIFITILKPYWSAFTYAYTKKEFGWIKKEMKILQFLWFVLFFLVLIMFFSSDFAIKLWVGKSISVPKDLYLVVALYVLINAFNSIYTQFINGVGKLMLQFYIALGYVFVHIPLTIYFGKYFGVKGILFSMIILGTITIIISKIQYKKIITGTATSIWNK